MKDVHRLKQRTGESSLLPGVGANKNTLPRASPNPGGARRRRLGKGPTKEPGPTFRSPGSAAEGKGRGLDRQGPRPQVGGTPKTVQGLGGAASRFPCGGAPSGLT